MPDSDDDLEPSEATDERKFTEEDWKALAEFGVEEKQSRKRKRADLEVQWTEIDRQLALKAKPRQYLTGLQTDWYPAIEQPNQFNALEVILADASAGIFPAQQPSWYEVLSDTSGDYFQRNQGVELVQDGVPTKLDQESVDAVVKATVDYFHKMYGFRERFNLFLAEMVKYGTGVGRVKVITPVKFTYEYRGTGVEKGPAFLPYSIRNTYLDDIPALVMHEGLQIAPMIVREEEKLFDVVRMAVEKGGPKKGWNKQEFARFENNRKSKTRRGTIQLIELEGDIIVPRASADSLILPQSRALIATGTGGPAVIRFQALDEKFHSHVVGHYMRQDVDSAYGVSPLMKGWPTQEMASFVGNDLLATSALRAKPPIAWDTNDGKLKAAGGPEVFPGAQWETDNPDGIKPQEIGDLTALFAVYSGLQDQYEKLTQANDPRRGGGLKSHQGTGAVQSDIARSLVRTDNFVQDVIDSPLQTILYLEYAMIRDCVGSGMMIPIDSEGMQGYIKVTKEILPERVNFRVYGAAGMQEQAQKVQSFFAAANFSVQLYAAAVKTGKQADLDFVALMTEAFEISGHQDAARFIRRGQAVPQGTPGTSAVPGGGGVDTSALLGSLQAIQGNA